MTLRRGGPAATARLPAGLSEPAPSPLPGERRGAAARPPPPSVTSGLGDDPSRCGPPAAPRALAAASSARLPAAQQVEGGCGRARISGGEAASAIGTTSGIRQRGPAPGRGRGESGRGDGAHSAACRARRAAGAGSARGQRVSRPYRTRAVAGRSLRHTDRGGGGGGGRPSAGPPGSSGTSRHLPGCALRHRAGRRPAHPSAPRGASLPIKAAERARAGRKTGARAESRSRAGAAASTSPASSQPHEAPLAVPGRSRGDGAGRWGGGSGSPPAPRSWAAASPAILSPVPRLRRRG